MANEVLCVFRDRCDVPSHREPSGGNRQATPGPAIDHVVFADCDRCQLLVFVMNEYEEKDSRNFDTSSLSMCEISVPTTWRVPALWLRNQNQVAGF